MLADNNGIYNIASYAEVHSYTAPRELYIVSRLMIGNALNPVAGNGAYYAKYSLNGQEREDYNAIGAGLTRIFIQSHGIKMAQGDVLVVSLKGLAGDTAVNVESSIGDVTPSFSGIFGGGPASVWSEEEKRKAINDLSKILSTVKTILSLEEQSRVMEAIGTIKESISSMIDTTSKSSKEYQDLMAKKVIECVNSKVDENLQRLDFLKESVKSSPMEAFSELKTVIESIIKQEILDSSKEVNKNILDRMKALTESISIIEGIIVKSAPTQILEDMVKQ